MRKSVFAGVVALLFFWVLPNFGQIITGTIAGMVTDSTGASLPDAQVVVLNEDTGVTRTVVSDAGGRYSAPQLNPGRYRVTTTKEGFQVESRSGIQLTVGREAVVNVQLQVGQVTQTVEVTGEAPLVQTTEAAVGYLINDRTISELPLNGRDISQLMLLNPGVTQNSNGKWGNADKGFGRRFSISGMRGEDNSYLLDGSYINDYYRHVPSGPSVALAGIGMVREFQMLTNSFSAAYGRALGGVFNAVTKSGTNQWHGSAYEFLRNSKMDAANFFDNKQGTDKSPLKRNQFGATLGGPVFRDKTFFFVAYEGMRERLSQSSVANAPSDDARRGILPVVTGGVVTGTRQIVVSPRIQPFLDMLPHPSPNGTVFPTVGTAEYYFVASQPTGENFGQGRIDHQISDNDSLFGRFTADNANKSTFRELPDRFEVGALESRLFTFSETHIFSPTLLSSFRFSYNRVIPTADHAIPEAPPGTISIPGQPDMAAFESIQGVLTGLRNTEGPASLYPTNRFAYHDDINWTRGNHSMQFGGMVERMHYNPYQPFRPYGEWRFPSLEAFLTADPDRIRGTPLDFGVFGREFRQTFLALYLQDDWRVTPNLSVNLGLRWEPYTVPTELDGLIDNQRNLMDAETTLGDPYWKNQSWTNFSPRIGFAWSPGGSGNTSVRGGFGIFYVPNDSAIYTTATVNSFRFSPRLQITDSVVDAVQPGAIAANFPNAVPIYNLIRSVPGTGTIYSPTFEGFDTPHAVQYSLNVQRQIGESNVVTLGYSGRRGLNLSSLGNYNLPLLNFNGTSLELPAGATLQNPLYADINYLANSANSWYNGFTAALQRRFAAGLQAQVSYTFSRAISEVDGSDTGNHASAGGGGSLKYAHDRAANRGLSGYQVKNAFVANYSYDLPIGQGMTGVAGKLASGWQVNGIVTLQDGGPFTVGAAIPRALADRIGRASPNLIPGFDQDNIVLDRSVWTDQGYFTTAAFAAPGCRVAGNCSATRTTSEIGNMGRNVLIGPGLAQWDMGLTKNTQLGEQFNLQFRAEFFNLMNRANFSAPGQVGNSSQANELFSRDGVLAAGVPLLRRTAGDSRQIQLGLRLVF